MKIDIRALLFGVAPCLPLTAEASLAAQNDDQPRRIKTYCSG